MNKIFLDVGGHCGCSIRCFNNLVPDAEDWEKYSFEPNPNLWDEFDGLDTELIRDVALDHNGTTSFWIAGKTKCGSTIDMLKATRQKLYNNEITKIVASCIDLSQWIRHKFNEDDYIFLKMDVECAEYPIFDKMLKDGTLSYINLLSGEFHNERCGVPKSEDERLKKAFKEYGLKFAPWDGMGYCLPHLSEPWHLNEHYDEVYKNMKEFSYE